MNLDDEERAGTRSRKHVKQKSLRLLSFIFMLLLLIFLYNLQPNQKTQVNVISKDIFEIKKHFKDTEEWTDYSFLRAQLTEAPKTNQPQQKQVVTSTETHSVDELRRLTNPIILSSVFTFKSTRRVPVTAVIQTVDPNQIYYQLKSVLTQTALAESIWVMCKDVAEKEKVMERIETLDKRRVHVMINHVNKDFGWMANTASDFIWILDQNVVPGKRYLESILKLTYTEEYKNTLIGTQAFDQQDGCMPFHSVDITNKPVKSQQVDMLVDNWLVYRTWIPLLLEEQHKDEQGERWFLGLTISRTLWKAGIRTIALPTDPAERAYWGDTRVQKKTGIATTSGTCQYFETHRHLIKYKPSLSTEIMLFADSEQQVIELAPLFCSMKESKRPTFVSTVPKEKMAKLVTSFCHHDDIDNAVYQLDLQKNVIRESALMHALDNHIAVTKPSVMIHTAESSISLLSQVTIIALPSQDIPHALWMAELPLNALQKWNDIKLKIMINTNNKPHGLTRLLQSINNAHLLNDDIELTILLDQTTDRVTQNVAESFQFKAKNKNKNLRHRIVPAQRAPLFTEAWYPTTDNEYAIILDNTIELSPFFYTYAKYSLLYYRYSGNTRNNQIFGISLYSPRLLETDASGRKLFQLDKDSNEPSTSSTYLMQWPSHLGAVFFPEHWREFHDYMTARLADRSGYDMQTSIDIQGLRSSQWTQSWRRYFEELIYLRGYVMVYPHFDDHVGLSTSHMELRTKAMREEFAQAISLFETPLMETDFVNELRFGERVLDIMGQDRESITELKLIGKEYQSKVSACSNDEDDYDPADLLCPFARIVSVTLENEKDPIPELPIRQVTLYKNSFVI